jgi:hypothetical protein
VRIVSAAQPTEDPTTSLAGALTAVLARLAAERPEVAPHLPWHAVTDPAAVAELAAIDADTTRLRAALETGTPPEQLDLVEGALEQLLRERGLR